VTDLTSSLTDQVSRVQALITVYGEYVRTRSADARGQRAKLASVRKEILELLLAAKKDVKQQQNALLSGLS
jgi:hypothetical protein